MFDLEFAKSEIELLKKSSKKADPIKGKCLEKIIKIFTFYKFPQRKIEYIILALNKLNNSVPLSSLHNITCEDEWIAIGNKILQNKRYSKLIYNEAEKIYYVSCKSIYLKTKQSESYKLYKCKQGDKIIKTDLDNSSFPITIMGGQDNDY